MIDRNPRTYSGNCSGRTAASSINATGFAGPMQPVKRESPDLRTDQTRFISRGSVTILVRKPIFLDCKIDNRSATSSSNSTIKIDSQGSRVEFEQIARRLKMELAFGLIEERTIDVFNSCGFEVQ